MSSPINELPRLSFTSQRTNLPLSDDEGTLSGEFDRSNPAMSEISQNYIGGHSSHSHSREAEHRLDDDLAMLQAERVVSRAQSSRSAAALSKSASMHRSRSRPEPVDQFDVNTNPIHEKAAGFKPPENPAGKAARVFKKIHDSSFLIRYITYIMPLVAIILIPLLIGALLFEKAHVGGVRLMWFCVWLEIVWLTLWGGRIVAKTLPWPVGLLASLGTNNSKKWRDMCKQLEIPATLFFWVLSIEISFLPIMIHNHIDGNATTKKWEVTLNKVIISLLVGASLNLVEKIIIQLIAISFHLRTYADRIELNKFQIGSLTKLYEYSKEKIAMDDSDFEEGGRSGLASGVRTPMQYLDKAQKNARDVFSKVGDVAGKVAGDFTGKEVTRSTHPRQVVLTLLSTTSGSQVLARRLYRTFVQEGAETVSAQDLKHAFESNEETDSAFTMFDRDLNGDISMSELESVCVEIGRERKSITASLKDLDSVVSKLDSILLFFVLIITLLILISLTSTSAAGVLTSAGSAVLALSWLFSGTAQEFLSSCIFVLIKHPFDVGDRVYLYGASGSMLKGDDYFVKEISLLYTEFKKMEGHIVQAPNSYLNTLFILNMRRSGGLAEAVPLTVKFGTTLDQIDDLRQRLLEFVKLEKREYQPNILTEIREIVEAHSVNLNVVFFYKSNWQNELLRLQRRNKFICALMISIQEARIEGPRMRIPGQKPDAPFYQHVSTETIRRDGEFTNSGPGPSGSLDGGNTFLPGDTDDPSLRHRSSQMGRNRGESISEMSKRVDFSLGMKDVSSGDMMGELFEKSPSRVSDFNVKSSLRSRNKHQQIREENEGEDEEEGENAQGNSLRHRASRSTESRVRFGSTRTFSESPNKPRSTHSVIHRNRFFSRRNRKDNSDGEYDDLMEQGMADIPESSAPPTRLDPRSGVVSLQAVQMPRDRRFSDIPISPQTSATSDVASEFAEKPARGSGSEAFEMKTLDR